MLIHTKLHRPGARPDLVERPRLWARLEPAPEQRVVLVSAPAGSGKTTLAVQWLERSGARSAWLSLDPHDDEPERFARYLVAAVRTADPTALPHGLALLSSPTTVPWAYLEETICSELARTTGPLDLVLDDVHVLGEPSIHELLQRLVQSLPATVRLILLTRADPPWPLARLRALGWLHEIRGGELQFSEAEARAWFADEVGERLDDESVILLQRLTEGWAAGLQLARLSLAGAADPAARARELSGQQRAFAEYFTEEVLSSLSSEVLELLTATAPLERFCASLCDHLLGAESAASPPARETLERMRRENLFLVGLDGEGRWYRYHHLFQQLVREHLREHHGAEHERRVFRAAAAWFACEGLVDEALRLWIAAGELDEATELLGAHLEAVVEEDLSRRRLVRWLALFPEGAEHGRMQLLVAHGFLGTLRWDLQGLARLQGQIRKLPLRDRDRQPLRAAADAQAAFLLYWQGDAEGALQHASRALEAVAPRVGGMTWAMATIYGAAALARTGRKAEAEEELARATAEDVARGSRHAGELLTAQVAIALYAADLDTAEEHARQMLTVHETRPLPDFWLGHALYFLGRIAYERDRLEEADEWFRAVEPLRYRTSSRFYQDAWFGRARVALALGDRDAARSHAEAALAAAVESQDPLSCRMSESFQLHLAQGGGDGVDAAGLPRWEADVASFWLEVPSLTHAQHALESEAGEGPEALRSYLEAAEQGMARGQNAWLEIAFSLLRAMALDASGEREAGRAQVSELARRAGRHGLVRTFLDRGPRLRELLEAASRRDGRRGHVGALLRAFDRRRSARAVNGARGAAATHLTEREQEVLELLSRRYSNQEIAARIHVGSETVKTHLKAIFRKLGAHDRRGAVRAARADGLLPEED